MGVSLGDLKDLHLVSLAGEDAVLAAPANRSNIIEPTRLWRAVQDCVSEIRPRLIVLDTLADLFAVKKTSALRLASSSACSAASHSPMISASFSSVIRALKD
jgi:RecA-family ATPase